MANIRRGAIPSELGWLIDMLDDYGDRLRTLEAPSAEAMNNLLESSTANTVRPVEVYRTEDPAAFTPAAADFATVNVVVPAGYTRALVSVVASASLRSNAAVGVDGLMTIAALVTGISAFVAWSSIEGQRYGSGTAASAGVIEGLAPGDVITARARVGFPQPFTVGRANISGSVLFLR